MEYYQYKKEEIVFFLHQLNEHKIKDLLTLGRNKLYDDVVLKFFDIARAFEFLSYTEQKIVKHLFFQKDSVNYIARYLNIEKGQIHYLKRNCLKKMIHFLNGTT